MIYSRWRPDTGGYDYFQSAERRGLGDDLPVPKLTGGTAIGVASTDIGRPAPGALHPAGSGPVAKGSILPLSRQGLSGLSQAGADRIGMAVVVGIAATVGAGVGAVGAAVTRNDVKRYAKVGAAVAGAFSAFVLWSAYG